MKILKQFGYLCIAFATSFFRAFVIFCLFKWFLVPFGVPMPEGILHTYGLLLLVSLAMLTTTDLDTTPDPEMGKKFFVLFFISLVWLGLGAVVHCFM